MSQLIPFDRGCIVCAAILNNGTPYGTAMVILQLLSEGFTYDDMKYNLCFLHRRNHIDSIKERTIT